MCNGWKRGSHSTFTFRNAFCSSYQIKEICSELGRKNWKERQSSFLPVFLPNSLHISSPTDIEELFKESGFPEGVVQVILASKDQVSKLIADDRISGVTITGSVETGKKIAKQAGEHLKKNVMELGGSDACISSSSPILPTLILFVTMWTWIQ